LFERLGFRCEARLVEADWFKGEWSTLRLYAMLDRDWPGRPARGRSDT
jgi:RimJ/RimL family protein N-acetyltransferase